MEKHHKRHKGTGALNLVSLMDIFTILVFFLLVNSSDVQTLPNAKDLQLPQSIAEEKAKETVVILIGETDIIVQGTPVAKVADVMATKGNNIPALRAALAGAERSRAAARGRRRYCGTGGHDHG